MFRPLKGHYQGKIRVIKYNTINNLFFIELRPHYYKFVLHRAVKCGFKINNKNDFKREVFWRSREVDGVGGSVRFASFLV
jgi:hypothetical protein